MAGLNTRPGVLGEVDVLRQEFALEALEVAAQRLFAIGEFPMAGHRLDAQQIRRLDHVGALRGVGQSCALPRIAAIEQQGAFGPGVVAQAIDQRLEMREAAELAKSRGGFFEIEKGEGVGVGAVGPDAKPIEKGAADQMRRLSGHRADPEIDARFAEIDRQQLRVRVGDVQDTRIAEAFEIIDAYVVGGARETWQRRRERGCAREFKKIPAEDGHAVSARLQTEFSVSRAPSRLLFRL
jgi:hypothetical protein